MRLTGLQKLKLLCFERKILQFITSYDAQLWRMSLVRQLRYSAANVQPRRPKVVDIQRYAKVVDIQRHTQVLKIRRRAAATETLQQVNSAEVRHIDIMLRPMVKLYYHPAGQNLYLLNHRYIVLHQGPRVSPWEWWLYRLCCNLLFCWRDFRRR